ncbi:MAG TPA: sigma-54 dependent transcriptional regulator [candidate division Zixibacteria bacterium]|nr:sigma-54 dependent transcriptional regulator [candidate division Zixibacteria bacterium]
MSTRTEKAAIYGIVLSEKERSRLEEEHPLAQKRLLFHTFADTKPSNGKIPVVFVDLDDPSFADSAFLLSLSTSNKQAKVIGKTVEPSLDQAMRVARLGVSEILTPEQCLNRLDEFLTELETCAPDPAPEKPAKLGIEALVGVSPQICEIRKTVNLLSEVDFPSALILGETGTGKSLISKILHNTGIRADHNLVEVNCSAIPDELFESELFGHRKGAFTDAKSEKMGLFEYAENGTLFLDEVGNLSASAQAKLLKILEDKKLRKVGDVGEKDVNVRVITATNLDLSQAIEAEKFREDLYFRLNLLTIEIPPLRERPDDIPELVSNYVRFYSTIYDKPGINFTESAVADMQGHPWPGNVRELCNVVERAVLLAQGGSISSRDISAALKRTRISAAERQKLTLEIPPQGITMDQIEQQVVKHVLNMFGWNKTEAARFLGISRPRLRRILDMSGLETDRRSR